MGTHLNYLVARERVVDITRAAERARLARGRVRDESALRWDGLFERVLAVARRTRPLRPLRPPAGWVRTSSSTGRDTAKSSVVFDDDLLDHEPC